MRVPCYLLVLIRELFNVNHELEFGRVCQDFSEYYVTY